jgi:protein-L-isoaspartate(D-aspartate) O-methyltransferase
MSNAERAFQADTFDRPSLQTDAPLANFLIGLRSSGIRRNAIISAFEEVHRRMFLPHELKPHAYAGFPLPIGCGEEATPPSNIARVLALAEPGGTERVLEIGTGTGYQTALLARMCRSLVSVERWRKLADLAAINLQRSKARNVEMRYADGLKMDSQERFDLVIVNATVAGPPASFLMLLKPEGRLITVMPHEGQPSLARVSIAGGEMTVDWHGPLSMPPIRKGVSVGL